MSNRTTPKKKHFEQYGNELYWLATEISHILAKNKEDNTSQKEQVEELILSEKLFKEEILKYKYSTQVYKKFIQKIKVQDHNILFAKPYFRESSGTFSKSISPCLKKNDAEGLKKFDVNFQLIQFIKDNWRGPLGSKAEKLYQRVARARRVLQENNLPLAINCAKLFYRKTPKSHLTLMDMISSAAMGLSSAIDKYKSEKYSEVFRSVILGRCTGYLIRDYSSTAMHFYPTDRKIMYRANAIRGRQGITEINELTRAVNESFKADAKDGKGVPGFIVQVSDLQDLMFAASTTSVETTVNEDGYGVYEYTAEDKESIETKLINAEAGLKISKLIEELPVIYRKVLKLKGVNF